MAILIHVARHSLRYWMLDLHSRLQTHFHMPVHFHIHDLPKDTPRSIETLLYFEQHILRRTSVSTSILPAEKLPNSPLTQHRIHHHINLTSITALEGLQLRYEGSLSENTLFSALLEGTIPHLAVHDAQGICRAAGLPSLENSSSFGQALDTIYALLTTLIIKALGNHEVPQSIPYSSCIHRGSSLRYATHRLAHHVARTLYKLCCYTPHWQIGWRWHDHKGVAETGTLSGTPWTVLPDDGLRFYADPFVAVWQGKTALFAEELPHRSGKGIISAILFENGKPKGTPQPILEEPWHLSYPCVFTDTDNLYMIPESSQRQAIVLYRCIEFPYRWEEHSILIPHIQASDATLLKHNGLYWLFCTTPAGLPSIHTPSLPPSLSSSDCLMLFYAETLFGPWHPHPLNPVLVDASQARPAGHFYTINNQLYRPAQDCRRGYGRAMTLCRVDSLSPEHYAQTPVHHVQPDAHWPGRRLHTLNRSGALEVIDGSRHNPKCASWFSHQPKF